MDLSFIQILAKLDEEQVEKNITYPLVKYKGVRLKMYENFLQVSQSNFDCIIKSDNGDYIKLKNVHINEALEKLLDIFYVYETWENKCRNACLVYDFEEIVKVSWEIFNNPMIINDTNMKNLAISRNVDVHSVNNEYWHLATYGFSSLSAYRRFADEYEKQAMDPSTKPIYLQNEPGNINPNMLCGILRDNNEMYGRILVVEYSRVISDADIQNLEYMCIIISKYLAHKNDKDSFSIGNNFINMVRGVSVTHEDIDKYYEYMGWNERDVFRLLTVSFNEHIESNAVLLLLSSYLKNIFPEFPCFIIDEEAVVLINENICSIQDAIIKIKQSYVYNRDTALFGFSLKFRGLNRINEFYKQSKFALTKDIGDYGSDKILNFKRYAVDYILESTTVASKLCACMPEIKAIYYNKDNDNTELFKTLKVFLMHNSSISETAYELGIHKNTVAYRISKFVKAQNVDINDSYFKEYMLISIRIFENYNHLITDDKYDKF